MEQTAEQVLASLLRQITESIPEVPKLASELYTRMKRQNRQLQQQDLEQATILTCASVEQTFIVIDALDECDTESRKDLLRALAILQEVPRVRIFLTSRPHVGPEITKTFGEIPNIEIGASDADLRTYLSSKIDNSDNVDVIDEEFKREIIATVIQAASKMYVRILSMMYCATEPLWSRTYR